MEEIQKLFIFFVSCTINFNEITKIKTKKFFFNKKLICIEKKKSRMHSIIPQSQEFIKNIVLRYFFFLKKKYSLNNYLLFLLKLISFTQFTIFSSSFGLISCFFNFLIRKIN